MRTNLPAALAPACMPAPSGIRTDASFGQDSSVSPCSPRQTRQIFNVRSRPNRTRDSPREPGRSRAPLRPWLLKEEVVDDEERAGADLNRVAPCHHVGLCAGADTDRARAR